MPLEDWIQHCNVARFVYDWQTLVAGVLALFAAWRVIAATREQTATTVRLERARVASEATAFRAMFEAAMARVLDEVDWARQTYPQLMRENDSPQSCEAFTVRNSITRGAFAELRAACIRLGSPLTGDFLDLEREIENFAMQWRDKKTDEGAVIREGMHAGLGKQLEDIETKATKLGERASEK
jgi:hypothetical protein